MMKRRLVAVEASMVIKALARQFAAQAPFCFMTRAVFEHAFNGDLVDEVFREAADVQYERELLFSEVVDLLCQVVLRGGKSVLATYLERQRTTSPIGVSVQSVYAKLNNVEPKISAALVRKTVDRLVPIVDLLGARKPALIPKRRVKILDGNHFAATEHRLKPLRGVKDAPLPSQALAILDPELDMVLDVLPCEDGHAQERSLTDALLEKVEKNDCIIGDRNFCTSRILSGVASRSASFLIRQHAANLRWELVGERKRKGRTETGTVYEQQMRVAVDKDKWLRVRRITIELDTPTRDGETQLHLLTNLPQALASAVKVAKVYRERWQIEGVFNDLTMALRCEVKTLGYPRAAILAFSLAVATYNLYSAIRAAVRATHGTEVEEQLSAYYVADEVAGHVKGMMLVLPPPEWGGFRDCSAAAFAEILRQTAMPIKVKLYAKHVRGPKKPRPPRKSISERSNHVSTQRLLIAARNGAAP
jgi:hypothetical protein